MPALTATFSTSSFFPMMKFPMELLAAIAAELTVDDLSNFRLTARLFARAGLSLVPQHGISILHTTQDMKAFLRLLQCADITNNIKTLRIFHAEWPISSRRQWEARRRPPVSENSAHQTTIVKNCSGISEEDEYLKEIMQHLPNLQKVIVSSAYNLLWDATKKPPRLNHTIQSCSFPSNEVSRSVESVLLALGPNMLWLKSLSILGYFNPDMMTVANPFSLSYVQSLHVKDFRVTRNEAHIHQFLTCFQNVQKLDISYKSWGPSPNTLDLIYWPSLRSLKINGLWTSEQDFFDAFFRHERTLSDFNLHNCALTEGSWRGLFTRLREIQSYASITGSGELYGRSSEETIDMNLPMSRKSLSDFMGKPSINWPFGNLNVINLL
ncbi:hypothetical protein ACEPPN_000326 [Leptodophora sp. 'Broadleaf-Isolate-01']